MGIRDVDAFVNATINATIARNGLWVSVSEREELELEAIAILYEWAADLRGGTLDGRAAKYLPGRIIDEWHRLKRGEHIRRPNVDGHRCWDYRTRVSLDDPTVGALAAV